LPTGTGKSLVIADFIKKVLSYWPSQRILMLTHVKELISQNADKLLTIWPEAPLGIYSAGLGKREAYTPIVYGGIASIVGNVEDLGHRDLVICDECQMIGPKDSSMYQQTFKKLRGINPNLKVIGLTATPYRLGHGMVTDDGLFDDICFDLTKLDDFNNLIKEGYLCPLIPKRTNVQLDVSSVGISNGDYKQNELQKAVDIDAITYQAIQEVMEQGADRDCWMFFASGVEHAEHITECLQSFGISAVCVHSKMPTKQRDEAIRDFKLGIHRAIVGNNVLTTGFDHPPIDLIAFLRPTTSPGLWVQALGRGTRPSQGKSDTLVLDFSGNTARLGPINDPVIPRKKGKATPGEVPVKLCPTCGVYHHSSVRVCSFCGHEFPRFSKLFTTASEQALIKTSEPELRIFDIDRTIYAKHQKPGAPASLRVTYFSGLKKFEEFVCLEHAGFARKKAVDWWLKRMSEKIPSCVDDALGYISELRVVKRIEVIVNRKYPEIVNHEF
jgi:DNA repair protein RadD